MTYFTLKKGRPYGVRCDGCGRISTDKDGYYFDKSLNYGGNISSQGRDCEHDFCNECERKVKPPYDCPKC
jgi:hypothetical protein